MTALQIFLQKELSIPLNSVQVVVDPAACVPPKESVTASKPSLRHRRFPVTKNLVIKKISAEPAADRWSTDPFLRTSHGGAILGEGEAEEESSVKPLPQGDDRLNASSFSLDSSLLKRGLSDEPRYSSVPLDKKRVSQRSFASVPLWLSSMSPIVPSRRLAFASHRRSSRLFDKKKTILAITNQAWEIQQDIEPPKPPVRKASLSDQHQRNHPSLK